MRLFSKKKRNPNYLRESTDYILTKESPFSMRESYKAVRTNLMFSLPSDGCRKILVTSASQHEGKSTSAINLGITFAENQAKVLLIDCDLRLPTDAKKLSVPATPGLSNLLAGLCTMRDAIRHLDNGLDLLPAGNIPPNPSELLGSSRMADLVTALEKYYDYIIFDSPPASAVTDAVVLSKLCSGVMLVVRRGVATQDSVNGALNLLELANAKICGFLFTGAVTEGQTDYYHRYG